MSDPLSVAASVAGLICFGAATSKLVYQFFSSIADAPKEVRAITSSFYGMSIALCQIQTLLLDLTYASQTDETDLTDLEQSVSLCVGAFSAVEKELNSVALAGAEDLTLKRMWYQVKHVFESETMKAALARLETEKATLQLILTALNSKSMAGVLRIIKDTEEVVRKNHHRLKSLELKMTRVLKDAISRSYTSTSSVSLDSLCAQTDIERMLTDYGSALNLTLTDFTEDSASLIVIPDNLSGVDCVSAKFQFPSEFTDGGAEPVSIISPETTLAPGGSTNPTKRSEDIRATKPAPYHMRATVDSYFTLSDTLKTLDTPRRELSSNERATVESFESLQHTYGNRKTSSESLPRPRLRRSASTAQAIIERIQSRRVPKSIKVWERAIQGLSPRSNPFLLLPPVEPVMMIIREVAKIVVALHAFSSTWNSQLEGLVRAERRMENLDRVMSSVLKYQESLVEEYLESCTKRATKVLTEYAEYVKKAYDSKRRAILKQALEGTADVDRLWAAVEDALNDLEKAVNFVLILEVRDVTHSHRQDGVMVREANEALLQRLSKIEASQSRIEGKLGTTVQVWELEERAETDVPVADVLITLEETE